VTSFRSILLLATVALLTAACSPGGGKPVANQHPAVGSCTVSTLQPGPDGFEPYGLARAGALWFSAFGRVDPGTAARLAADGEPYDGWKVVIHSDAAATGTVSLTGVQCSTGRSVRFCYSATGCDWVSRVQSSVTTLRIDASRHVDYAGYMVFPGPGLMRLTARDSRDGPGSVVIEVPSTSAVQVPPAGSRRLEGGCGATAVYEGGSLPDWATVNAPKGLPYVVAEPALAVGYIFSHPMQAGHAANNKILWYVGTPRDGSSLNAVGHPLGSATPTAAFSKAADSFPGEIYPSGPTVPSPGCWHFTLRWHGGDEHVDVDLMFE
jgi:hypothetical protein